MINQKFGMLTVIRPDSSKTRSAFLCKCDCGNEKVILRQSLVGGKSNSCGCARIKYDHPDNYDSGVYKIWHSMIRRCYNKGTNGFEHYKKRGITVCDRWLGKRGFVNFVNDMGDRPSLNHSIDRVDNDGIYEPSNCKWATPDEQGNNRSNNVNISINGTVRSIAQWARIYGINSQTICERMKRGWSGERAVTEPVNKSNRGRTLS